MSTRKFITISIGDVFGRLTVVAEAPQRGYRRYWLCQCSCGSPAKEVRGSHLSFAQVKSCGCLVKELSAKSAVHTGKLNTTHGKSKTKEYRIWNGMWQRCTNPNQMSYQDYKNRTPPDAWKDFEVFLTDMRPRPSSKHSIERVDNDKPYGPDNCVWATIEKQSHNRSSNVNIEYQGRSQCIAAWAEEYGIAYRTMYYRLVTRKWSIEKALNTK